MYLDKICKNCKDRLVSLPCMPSMAIPHQSFTPREILAQFVRNDVQVQRLEPTDSVDSLDAMSFEDDFEARQFVRNEMPEILEQRKQQSQDLNQEQSQDLNQEQSQDLNQERSQDLNQERSQENQKSEDKPVKVEVVTPEKPYTTGFRSYL